MLRSTSRLALAPVLACSLSLGLSLAACETAAPPRPAVAPAPPPVVVAPPAPASATGRLRRGDVDQILVQQGPPWVLRRVISEEVIRRDGKFTGWRLVGLPDEWRGIDLKPGDVVSRVNGLPVETPDEAWEAWKSVASAPELRIALTRDGAARDVIIPIDGEPSSETLKALGNPGAPPRAAAAAPPPARRNSVQLGGSAATEAPEDESY